MSFPGLPINQGHRPGGFHATAGGASIIPEDIEGLDAYIERQVVKLLGGVLFAEAATGANLALTGSFQTGETVTFTPPAGWGRYRILGMVGASVSGVTSGDNIQIAAQIVGTVTGEIVTDNAASDYRSVESHLDTEDLEGEIDMEVKIRNNTASRGTAVSSWGRIWAVRQT